MLWDENDIYGGIYDLDGNGYTDASEVALSFQMIEELNRQDDSIFDDDSGASDESDDLYYPVRAFRSGASPEGNRTAFPAGDRKDEATPAVETPIVIPPAEEWHMTYSEYKTSKQAFAITVLFGIAVFLVLSVLPALFIWAAIDSYDYRNDMSGPVTTVIVLIAGGLILTFFIGLCKAIAEAFSSLIEDRERFRRTAEKRELSRIRKKKVIAFTLVCILVCAVAALAATVKMSRERELENKYTSALQLIEDGTYQEAYDALKAIRNENYKDTESMMDLCQAHIEYERENAFSALVYIESTHFSYLTQQQRYEIDQFKKEVQALYNNQRLEREAKQRQQAEERISTGVPYVGMKESRIGDTSLGKPAEEIRHNSEIRRNTLCHFNLYDWFRNGQLIFTVRCLDGEVIQVWDYRNNPITPYQPSSGSKKKYDYPDYDDYLDAEDLYDWYYDDFYDYEEAEEYLDGWD